VGIHLNGQSFHPSSACCSSAWNYHLPVDSSSSPLYAATTLPHSFYLTSASTPNVAFPHGVASRLQRPAVPCGHRRRGEAFNCCRLLLHDLLVKLTSCAGFSNRIASCRYRCKETYPGIMTSLPRPLIPCQQHVTSPPDNQKNFLVVDNKTDNAAIESAFERFTTERKDIGIVLINQHVCGAICVSGVS
jgi:hypothetical protein